MESLVTAYLRGISEHLEAHPDPKSQTNSDCIDAVRGVSIFFMCTQQLTEPKH